MVEGGPIFYFFAVDGVRESHFAIEAQRSGGKEKGVAGVAAGDYYRRDAECAEKTWRARERSFGRLEVEAPASG